MPTYPQALKIVVIKLRLFDLLKQRNKWRKLRCVLGLPWSVCNEREIPYITQAKYQLHSCERAMIDDCSLQETGTRVNVFLGRVEK